MIPKFTSIFIICAYFDFCHVVSFESLVLTGTRSQDRIVILSQCFGEYFYIQNLVLYNIGAEVGTSNCK